ncbi:MAG: hypothetical protein PHT33_12530 [bacterium]|nr:hypothetical protein [bacterium]
MDNNKEPVVMKSRDSSISWMGKRPISINWGKTDSCGLQLGIWLDYHQPIIRAVVRNQGDQPIRYSDYNLGYWEAVSIRARKCSVDEWHIIPRKQRERWHNSSGACSKDVHIIYPKEEMKPRHQDGEKPLVPTEAFDYTFSVDMRDFDWPGYLLGPVEVSVTQYLGNDASVRTWGGILESVPIRALIRK